MTQWAAPKEVIAEWRAQALKAIEPAADVTPLQRATAWRFLLQHGVRPSTQAKS